MRPKKIKLKKKTMIGRTLTITIKAKVRKEAKKVKERLRGGTVIQNSAILTKKRKRIIKRLTTIPWQ